MTVVPAKDSIAEKCCPQFGQLNLYSRSEGNGGGVAGRFKAFSRLGIIFAADS